MSFNKFLANLSKHQLIYGAVGIEFLNVLVGFVLGIGGLAFILTGIIIAIISVYLSAKNKIAVNKEILQIEDYKSQNKIMIEALGSCAEALDNPNFTIGIWDQLIQHAIFPILQELNFIHDPGIRVSLYSHSGKYFTLLYRHSDDPEFKKKGRAIYPDNEGIIGNAYHKNEGHAFMLPSAQLNEEEWIKAQLDPVKGCMKDPAVVKNLTMKARNLFALPIRNGHDKHMVIVFESIKDSEFDVKLIKKTLESHYGLKLKSVLILYKPSIEPSLSYADSMGV